MNKTRQYFAGLVLAAAVMAPHLTQAAGPEPLNLRSTARFAILAGAEITTTGGGTINGDVGASPIAGSAILLTQAQVNGTIFTVDATGPAGSVMDPDLLTAAKGDLTTAFNDAAGRTPVPTGPFLNPNGGNIGGLNLVPGLYKFTSTALITGSDVTLTGGPEDVWIFQIAADLQVGSGIKVILAGGAQAKNIFWQVGTSAVLDTFSVFKGTILADQAITLKTSSVMEGRALAFSAGVTYNGQGSGRPDESLTIISEHGAGTPPAGFYSYAFGSTLTNLVTGTETLGGTQYVATGWSMLGNAPASGSATNMTMVLTNSATLTWLWATNHLLSATAGPNGSVTGSTNGFYAADSTQSVTAVPAPGYFFAGWTGDADGPTNAAAQTLPMDRARTLSALFSLDPPAQVTLTVVSEHGTGTPPAGVYTNDIGATLTNLVTGTETLGGTQYVATGWSMLGNAPASGSATNMTMVLTNSATLTWLWATNHLLSATAGPNGSVTGSANGFYAAGSIQTVTAVPAPGFFFAGWTGDASGPANAAAQTLPMDRARTLSALFSLDPPAQITLTVVSEHGTGTPPAGVYTNDIGATLTNLVTGTETLGGTQYVATGWSMLGNEPASGSATNMTMVLTNSATLTWLWATNHLLSASAGPNGSVTGSANGFYAAGSIQTVTAVPAPGYFFAGWTGDASGPANAAAQTLPMDRARTLTAQFTHIPTIQTPSLPEWLNPTNATKTHTFNGWAQAVGPDPWVDGKGAASMTVTIRRGKAAAITGVFMLGAHRYTFLATGYEMDADSNLVIRASCRIGNDRFNLAFSVRGDAVYSEDLSTEIQLFRNTFTGATPVNGYYTVALPSLDGSSGSGYVTMTVGAKGRIKAAGRLGDGAVRSLSTTLLKVPNWFWSAEADDWVQTNSVLVAVLSTVPQAYRGGDLFGLIEFATESTQNKTIVRLYDTNAPIRWVSMANRGSSTYQEGFKRSLGVTGGYFTSAELLQTYYIGDVPEVADLTYTFTGATAEKLSIGAAEWNPGGLVISGFKAPKADKPMRVDGAVWPDTYDYTSPAADRNQDGILNTTGLEIRFTRPTGIFRGSFHVYYDAVTREDPLTGVQKATHTDKRVAFQGVALPVREDMDDGIEGRGYFLMRDQSTYENNAGRIGPYTFNWSYDFLLTK